MDRTAPRARAGTRALAVLTVLLGLLAMHGLASTHHAAAAPAAAQQDTGPALPAGHEHGSSAVPTAAEPLAAPDGPGCGGDCSDLAVLCLAVLGGAAVALLLARRRHCQLPPAPSRHHTVVRAPPARHARGPDPVKELCVSRT